MGNKAFEDPVWVFSSDYFCRQVASAREAMSFLRGWRGRRALFHSQAMAICTCALAGSLCAESAREAFVEFAEREKILVANLSGALLNAATRGPHLVVLH